ncbi:MAG: murein biosynthesis integral membrane protein MurJ [Synergistaceae bacterium]|nr:murein biosynthesis integral membrane protein MurJ [Synergistaceae bacterium]
MPETKGSNSSKLNTNSSHMVRHALFMMAGTFASRILGLLREIMTAAYFGATAQLDAFNIAYTLSNLSRQLLAEGALSAAFVPVFSNVLAENGKDKAFSLARQAMSILMTAAFIVTVLGIAVSPLLVSLMAPGFDGESSALAANLTRLMFPFLFIISIAALTMGVLNSLGSFFVPSLAPAFSNLSFLIILPFLIPFFGIYGLAFAVLIGGSLNLASQWLWSKKTGAVLLPEKPDLNDPNLKKMMRLFLPYAIGLSLNQLNPILSRMFASFLEEGAISALNYANRILQLPLGLFVIAVSQAVLPQLSRIPKTDTGAFGQTLSDALRFVLFIVLPVTIANFIYSDEIVHLIFVRGAFGESAWAATSIALKMSIWGLPGMACSTVVMRGLYALGLAKGAFYNTLISVICTLVSSLLLIKPFGLAGLAAAPSIAFTIASAAGIYAISKELNKISKNHEENGAREKGASHFSISKNWMIKIAFCLLALTGFMLLLKYMIGYDTNSAFTYRALLILFIFASGAAAYAILTIILKFDEWHWLRGAMRTNKTDNHP